ncbi:DUF4397 domain-containing protein [Niabella insulamsoli]|uniref:DUF4397 domain-containing protein n=1 Tax=Niabella insulamsoli TaxID=3144874 RepID=UPI0031FE1D6A
MKIKLLIPLLALLVSVVLSCSKEDNEGIKSTFDTNLDGNAQLKVNLASVYRSNPQFRIRINDQIITDPFPAREPYPGGGYNTGGGSSANFLAIPAGNVKVTVFIPFTKTGSWEDTLRFAQDSIRIYETTINVEAGKHYSLHTADTANNFKNALIEESLALTNDTLPHFKFVNLMPNVPALDLYLGTVKVASNISYLSSSPEFIIDPTVNTSTSWTIRPAGALPTSTAVATYSSASTILRGRKYTAFAMGYSGLSGTSEPRRPFISFYLIR